MTHTRLRAQLVGGGCVCGGVDIVCVHLCLELSGQSLEECRLSDLGRENAGKFSFYFVGESRKVKASCSSFGDSCLTFNPCQKSV